MTERERAINRDLHVLDEAHRLGRISRDEYRARRRRVLESLYDSGGVVTARKKLVPPDANPAPRSRPRQVEAPDESLAASGHALNTLLSMRPGIAWKSILALLLGVGVLILFAWWLLSRQ